MKIFKAIGDIFRNRDAAQTYGSGFESVGSYDVNDAMVSEMVSRNATLFSAIDFISKIIANVKFRTEDGYWQRTLDNPNLFESPYGFMYALAGDLVAHGNAYVLRRRGKKGTSNRLGVLDVHNVHPIGTLAKPQYRLGDEAKIYGSEEIIHFRYGIGTKLRAIGRVSAGYSRIRALESCDQEINSVFENGIAAQFILSGGKITDKDALKSMVERIKTVFGAGGSSRGGVVSVPANFELKKLDGISPADTNLRELRTDLIREIGALFGIPPFVIGSSGQDKYSNTSARHQQQVQSALLPVAQSIADTLSKNFGSPVTFNASDLMKGDFKSIIDVAVSAAGGPVMTPNEARSEYLGLDKVEGGDKLGNSQAGEKPIDDRRDELDPDGSENPEN